MNIPEPGSRTSVLPKPFHAFQRCMIKIGQFAMYSLRTCHLFFLWCYVVSHKYCISLSELYCELICILFFGTTFSTIPGAVLELMSNNPSLPR